MAVTSQAELLMQKGTSMGSWKVSARKLYLWYAGQATGVEVDVLQRLQAAELNREGRGHHQVVWAEGVTQVRIALHVKSSQCRQLTQAGRQLTQRAEIQV